MHRTLPAVCILVAASAHAQTPPRPTPLAFDVASVRPSKSGIPQHTNVPLDSGNVYTTISSDDARTAAGGLLIATHQPLWRYISFAYKLSGTQELSLRFNYFSGAPKSGAPFWVTGSFDSSPEFFDIEARAPANTSIDQMRLMMQSLLADRFHLAAHYITADAAVFSLILAKPGVIGPNLQRHPASDSCAAPAAPNQPAPDQPPTRQSTAPSVVGDLPPVCGILAHVPSSTPGQDYGGRAVPLSLLATSLPTMTGMAVIPRPVVDQTGLSGLYDFTLNWMHDPAPDGSSTSDNTANFRDALKSQLGLELKPARAPIDILIIDHIERPSEN
jgi:uncharacterized protein (TIGR03435 family)